MTDLSTIEGIGPVFEDKLKSAGIRSCEQLLKVGTTAAGRKQIVEQSGIDSSRILRFVNHADLCRIKGVGGEYSELLEAAGVDSVPELAQRNAENLTQKLSSVNDEKQLVRVVPTLTKVNDWIDQAQQLPKVVTH